MKLYVVMIDNVPQLHLVFDNKEDAHLEAAVFDPVEDNVEVRSFTDDHLSE